MYTHSLLRRFTGFVSLICLIGFVLSISSVFADAPDPDMAGTWKGVLEPPEGENIELFLEFFKTAEGEDRAFLTVPSQDYGPAVLDTLTIDGEKFRFTVNDPNGFYEGKLERGKQITGTWNQNGGKYPLDFIREAP